MGNCDVLVHPLEESEKVVEKEKQEQVTALSIRIWFR